MVKIKTQKPKTHYIMKWREYSRSAKNKTYIFLINSSISLGIPGVSGQDMSKVGVEPSFLAMPMHNQPVRRSFDTVCPVRAYACMPCLRGWCERDGTVRRAVLCCAGTRPRLS